MAFSQQAVNWLAEKYGFKFPKSMKLPERLKVVQAAMEKGDSKAKFACYSRCFLTSYFCIPVPYNEKDIFFRC